MSARGRGCAGERAAGAGSRWERRGLAHAPPPDAPLRALAVTAPPSGLQGRHRLVRGGRALRLRLAGLGLCSGKTPGSGCPGTARRLFACPLRRRRRHGGGQQGGPAWWRAAVEGSVPAVKREFQDFALDRVPALSPSLHL